MFFCRKFDADNSEKSGDGRRLRRPFEVGVVCAVLFWHLCKIWEGRQGVPAEIFCLDDAWSVRCVRFLRLAERSCEGPVRLSLAGEKGGGRMPDSRRIENIYLISIYYKCHAEQSQKRCGHVAGKTVLSKTCRYSVTINMKYGEAKGWQKLSYGSLCRKAVNGGMFGSACLLRRA